MDERIKTLAKNLVNYSCRVKAGDKVYINYTGPSTEDLTRQLVKEVYAAGGLPFVHYINPKIQREVLMNCTEEQLKLMADLAARKCRRWTAISACAAATTYRSCRTCRRIK